MHSNPVLFKVFFNSKFYVILAAFSLYQPIPPLPVCLVAMLIYIDIASITGVYCSFSIESNLSTNIVVVMSMSCPMHHTETSTSAT